MIYTDFHGEKLSLLGFGTMRLPLVPGGGPADIDEKPRRTWSAMLWTTASTISTPPIPTTAACPSGSSAGC
ncbi:MAG: hypothetical protein ACLR5H_06095 [Oscillospiraceae bacterium]